MLTRVLDSLLRRRSLAAVISLGLAQALFTSTPGQAQDAPPTPSQQVSVQFDRSDLGSLKGVSRLYRRIEYASWIACETPHAEQDLFLDADKDRTCQSDKVSSTVKTINDQRLTAFQEAHGRPPSGSHDR